MENKINIAELLKDCPRGMELDCTMYDDCTFEGIEDVGYIDILVKTPRSGIIRLTKEGCYIRHDDYAKCVIFPKGKTTWEGFHRPFKDGDIVVDDIHPFIYKDCDATGMVKSYCGIDTKGNFHKASDKWTELKLITFATEEEKTKLFQSIKDNGYHWNDETKTLERLFPYNIGTKVWVKSDKEHKYIHTIVGISRNSFGNLEYEVKEEKTGIVVHYPESLLIPIETKEPKFKVGNKIKHKENGIYCTLGEYAEGISAYRTNIGLALTSKDLEQWELIPNKFDINTLKPFDKVLVRIDNGFWKISFFEKIEKKNKRYPFVCIGYNRYSQCIPYEGNEYLLSTTNDCDNFYKN